MAEPTQDPTGPIGRVEMPGVVNMRDLGGMRTRDGLRVRRGKLLRSDNLQDLPEVSVRRLVDEFGVSDVVDLRTGAERASTGPGPMTREQLTIHELTLYPEDEDSSEHGIPDADGEPEFPWQDQFTQQAKASSAHDEHLAGHYLGYLEGRPDHVVAALRAIAEAPGAVIVHCAAGKDRTGTICALALTELGVGRREIVADYDATNQRIALIFERLANSETYRADMAGQQLADQTTPASTMRMLLDALDEQYGTGEHPGVHGWLLAHGWTEDDSARLREALLEPDPG